MQKQSLTEMTELLSQTIGLSLEDVPKIEKREVKLKFFRGATIEDVDDNINLILNKEPDFTIIYM